MASIKGPAPAPTSFPGAEKLRIGIVHARWNEECITPLVNGCIKNITAAGVKPENIVVESVPGSWELPFGVSRLISASQVQASSNVSDLMGATSLLDDSKPATPTTTGAKASKAALDAVIGIGVLIKGSTMHFEYISESCCSGLMRIGLDTGVPVILGVLTALTEDQALERSGVGRKGDKGHNHGLDWGSAAVEMALKTNRWAEDGDSIPHSPSVINNASILSLNLTKNHQHPSSPNPFLVMSASPDLTLFYLENSRAFRVAWLLEHLSLPYTLKQFRRIEGKRAEPTLRSESTNPLGKSPYLIDGDVQVGESSAIVKYLITRYASQRQRDDLLGSPSNWSDFTAIESFISFSEGMMIHTLSAIYPRWFSTPEIAKEIEAGLSANIHNNLNFLEQSLSRPNANGFLVAGRLTAADIMCAFTAEYTFHMDTGITSQGKKMEDWPKTVEWLKGLSRLESYQKVLGKGVVHKFTISE